MKGKPQLVQEGPVQGCRLAQHAPQMRRTPALESSWPQSEQSVGKATARTLSSNSRRRDVRREWGSSSREKTYLARGESGGY